MSYELYIDSDGVIADFDRKAVELLGGKRIHEVPKGTLWAKIGQYNKDVSPFFDSLELMQDAQRLVDFALENFPAVKILTATGFTPADGGEQKIRWYARHFPGLEVVVVKKSPDKAQYAHPRAILVDDRSKSIDPWLSAGGIGILHTSVDNTIETLKGFIG